MLFVHSTIFFTDPWCGFFFFSKCVFVNWLDGFHRRFLDKNASRAVSFPWVHEVGIISAARPNGGGFLVRIWSVGLIIQIRCSMKVQLVRDVSVLVPTNESLRFGEHATRYPLQTLILYRSRRVPWLRPFLSAAGLCYLLWYLNITATASTRLHASCGCVFFDQRCMLAACSKGFLLLSVHFTYG